jgi:hypothetical protein
VPRTLAILRPFLPGDAARFRRAWHYPMRVGSWPSDDGRLWQKGFDTRRRSDDTAQV